MLVLCAFTVGVFLGMSFVLWRVRQQRHRPLPLPVRYIRPVTDYSKHRQVIE